METVQRSCPQCGAQFQANTIGRPRVYCGVRCRALHNEALNAALDCDVDGCLSKRYQGRRYCMTHAMRKHRNGSVHTDRSRVGRTWGHSNGYRIEGARGHEVADRRGGAYIHRVVLRHKIGGGTHECHWCGDCVTWGVDLEVDHLNDQRDDNRPDNLVPSCHGCNVRRGMARRYGHPWPAILWVWRARASGSMSNINTTLQGVPLPPAL